jgi:hypothetical protein
MYQGAEHTGRRVLNMGGGGGGPTTSTTYTSNIPEWLRPQTEALLGAGTQEYFRTTPRTVTDPATGQPKTEYDITGLKPFRPYSENKESYFAPFTQQQQNVFSEVGGMRTPTGFQTGQQLTGAAGAGGLGTVQGAYGYGGQGAGYGGQGAGYGQQAAGMGGLYERMATDPMSVEGYMSPYMQQVVERQKLAAIEDAQRANLGANLGSVRSGTYGGARQTLAQSQREAALEKQLGDIQAGGLQSAFEQAQKAQQFGVTAGLQGLQTGVQGAGLGITGAGLGLQGVQAAQAGYGLAGQMGRSLADIAGAQQQADIQRVGLQSDIGAQQQAREQGIIDQRIQDFALAEQYPFQQLSGYSGLLRGYSTPTTTISQYRAAQSPLTQLAGTGIQLGGAAQALGVGGGRKAGGQIKSYAQGGITSVDALESMAEDLSIPQIQQSVKNKTLPGYVGIPILENKVNNAERMKMAQGIAPDMGQQVPIADKVMQRANALQGIDSVQTAAGGGMVAFDDGGVIRFQNTGAVPSIQRGVTATNQPSLGSAGRYPLGIGSGPMPPDIDELVKKYGKNILKLFKTGKNLMGLSPMQALFKSTSLNANEAEELEKARNLAGFQEGYGQNVFQREGQKGGPEYTGIEDVPFQNFDGIAPKVSGKGGAADAANQGDKAGPAKQGGPGAPGGETPVEKELSRAELFALREKEQKDFLGEDPRIAKMQEALAKQGEEGFLDRALRGLQYVVAGEKIKKEGDTSQLEKITQSEMARRKEMADREMKKAELEGVDYQRKAGLYEKVAEEDRERAKSKKKQAFDLKVLERKIDAEKEIAGMRPATASEYIGRLLKSKSPEDQAVGKILAGQGKTGEMTRAKAIEMYYDPTNFEIRKQHKTFEDFLAYAMGAGVGRRRWSR